MCVVTNKNPTNIYMEGLRGTSTTITANWYRPINDKPHSGISFLVFYGGASFPWYWWSIAIPSCGFYTSKKRVQRQLVKETGCSEMCWDQFCSKYTGYSYIVVFWHLRLLYCYIPWCGFSSMFLFPLSHSRPFFSKPPILNKDSHIFVSAEFWRGDRYVVHLPRSFEEQKSRAALGSWERNSFIDQGICQNKWGVKIRASFLCFFWIFLGSRRCFFGVQERYFWMFGYYPISHLDQCCWSLSLGFESTMPSSRTQTNPKIRCSAFFHWRHMRKPSTSYCLVFLSFYSNWTRVFSTTPKVRNSPCVEQSKEFFIPQLTLEISCVFFPNYSLSASCEDHGFSDISSFSEAITAEKPPICCAAFGQKSARSVMVSGRLGWMITDGWKPVFYFKICSPSLSGWWFQTFSIFTPTWGNDPIWLIFFKWVETTNKPSLCSFMIDSLCPVVYLFRKRT